MSSWTWVAASCRGTSHVQTGTRRQDAFSCFIRDGTFVCVLSDGAGSAALGGQGASLVCRTLSVLAREHMNARSDFPDEETIWQWVDAARDRIACAAENRCHTPRDFAATLIMLMSSGTQTLVAHIGDGSAVVRDAGLGEWLALSWPEQGEYASTTYFVTDDPQPRLRVSLTDTPVTAAAIFTDGIERLALDFTGLHPHQPFFSGIIQPVDTSSETGRDRPLSLKLGAYLDSDAINTRTNDDKTLALAVLR